MLKSVPYTDLINAIEDAGLLVLWIPTLRLREDSCTYAVVLDRYHSGLELLSIWQITDDADIYTAHPITQEYLIPTQPVWAAFTT